MDITFQTDDGKFNYRVCAMILSGGKILAMHDQRSPYFYLPGGRVAVKEEYFYPLFLKEAIFHLPETFTIRTERE